MSATEDQQDASLRRRVAKLEEAQEAFRARMALLESLVPPEVLSALQDAASEPAHARACVCSSCAAARSRLWTPLPARRARFFDSEFDGEQLFT